MIGIYKITNTINGKVYIGQSKTSIENRWKEHFKKYKTRRKQLYSSMIKHGIENFKFEIIEELTIDKIDKREKFWIKQYNSYKYGYNANEGGSGVSTHSEETKRKISESAKGKQCSEETKRKISYILRKKEYRKIICLETKEIFDSAADCERKMFGFISKKNKKPNGVWRNLNGKRKQYKGYHFEYI